MCQQKSTEQRKLLNKNSELQRFNFNANTDVSRSFASLAWFGLWGKTPAKPTEAGPYDLASPATSAVPSSPPPAAESIPAPPQPAPISDGYIPEPPPIIDENIILNAIGEPTLRSLGLGSYFTPVGWFELAIEYLHVDIGLSWFQAIAVFALVLRTCLFPVTIYSQRNASKMRKVGPQMAILQAKITDAKISGDQLKVARATNEFMQFMKINQISFGSMFKPMLQVPFIISAFMGIRAMCKLPVESMETGGVLWFSDLTSLDPLYILPCVATGSILAMLYKGIDIGVSAQNMSRNMKLTLYGLSCVSFPFFLFMPSGVMVYLCTSNVISLMVSLMLDIKPVKRFFKIPILTPFEEQEIKVANQKRQNFAKEFYNSIKNQKLMAEIKERENLIEKKYTKAGSSVPIKTYKIKPKDDSSTPTQKQ